MQGRTPDSRHLKCKFTIFTKFRPPSRSEVSSTAPWTGILNSRLSLCSGDICPSVPEWFALLHYACAGARTCSHVARLRVSSVPLLVFFRSDAQGGQCAAQMLPGLNGGFSLILEAVVHFVLQEGESELPLPPIIPITKFAFWRHGHDHAASPEKSAKAQLEPQGYTRQRSLRYRWLEIEALAILRFFTG